MARKVLVSLVSDQTIPNIQLIKELGDSNTDIWYITTKKMEDIGTRRWIEETSGRNGSFKIVNEFSFEDIDSKLNEINFNDYERIILNITGGTKIMTLVAFDFFKNLAAEIYYVTGYEDSYIKIFPLRGEINLKFNTKINVYEYLKAYGFTIKSVKKQNFDFNITENIFNAYINLNLNDFVEEFRFLYSRRRYSVIEEDYVKIEKLINALGYSPNKVGSLNKQEVMYLTGDWFEEYVGLRLKTELELTDDEILIGTVICKELPESKTNNPLELLGNKDVPSDQKFDNELDVMFMYKNKFYIVECKTSIIGYKTVKDKAGKSVDKPYNILGETLYKSDSLRNRFGLYASTRIITLTSFKEYCADEKDKNIKNSKMQQMNEFIGRANLSRIKLIDKELVKKSKKLFDILK